MSLAAAAATELVRLAPDRVVVSRAASPELRRELERALWVVEAPVLRGKTVWEAAGTGAVCIESPNWWGRDEHMPPDRACVVVDRRRSECRDRLVEGGGPPDWTKRVGTLRSCLRSAAQVRGVRPAHGDPEAPWAILCLPISAESVAARALANGVTGVAALEPRIPELPGGIRLCLPEGAGSEWCSGVVASIVHEMERIGGSA